MSYGLPNYRLLDNSDASSPGVSGLRSFGPYGCLIHTTNGVASGAWLAGGSAVAGTPASSNDLIQRDGTIIKLCKSERFPYHAGKSQFLYHNRTFANDDVSQWFYGIELEALDTQTVTVDQYRSLAQRVWSVGVQYGWPWPFTILGHYAVANAPRGRRWDPYQFDWGLFGALLAGVALVVRGQAVLTGVMNEG